MPVIALVARIVMPFVTAAIFLGFVISAYLMGMGGAEFKSEIILILLFVLVCIVSILLWHYLAKLRWSMAVVLGLLPIITFLVVIILQAVLIKLKLV